MEGGLRCVYQQFSSGNSAHCSNDFFDKFVPDCTIFFNVKNSQRTDYIIKQTVVYFQLARGGMWH